MWKIAFPDALMERLPGRKLRRNPGGPTKELLTFFCLSLDRSCLASFEQAGLYDKDKTALLSFLLVEIKKYVRLSCQSF